MSIDVVKASLRAWATSVWPAGEVVGATQTHLAASNAMALIAHDDRVVLQVAEERERAEKAEARVQELEKAYKDAAGKLAGVRLIALSWEDDARNLNIARTLPASTLMDCREQILTALGGD